MSMDGNEYAGAFEDWKIEAMRSRARRMGFRGADLEDALQDLAMELLDFKFDAERANGCQESTVLINLIDCRLKDMRRGKKRASDRDEKIAKFNKSHEADMEAPQRIESEAEINLLTRKMPQFDQAVLKYLKDGKTIKWIARKLDCRWHTVKLAVERIRMEMDLHGLIPPGYCDNV